MYTVPMIFPLDAHGNIYVLQDDKGNTIGTGKREVCEVLLHLITSTPSPSIETRISSPRSNVRAAITI
jgi:hypothetical protein